MEIYFLLAQKKGDGRMCAKMIQLGSDVFLRRLDQAIGTLEIGIVLMHQAACGSLCPTHSLTAGKS